MTPEGKADDTYELPRNRLRTILRDPSKTPLCLVSCGSFSPITYLHLRLCEMAADYVRMNTEFELVGGYLSPVSDAYNKAGLASAEHRVRMCQLAVDAPSDPSDWLMVDPWEAMQKDFQRTVVVLDRFDREVNAALGGGVQAADGQRRRVKIALVAGADLIQSMLVPGLWSAPDIDCILRHYGAFVVQRAGTNTEDALTRLNVEGHNAHAIEQLVPNEVSSTRIRQLLRQGMSVRYLVPPPVIRYIGEHGLYA